jgi:tripartite-type tricarboxylate transporter receptor subunit TctC
MPTIAESGLATYEVSQWSGVVAPAATPGNIVATLHREIAYIMNLADVRERLPALGLEPMSGTSGEFAKYLDADIRKWARVARESGARLD